MSSPPPFTPTPDGFRDAMRRGRSRRRRRYALEAGAVATVVAAAVGITVSLQPSGIVGLRQVTPASAPPATSISPAGARTASPPSQPTAPDPNPSFGRTGSPEVSTTPNPASAPTMTAGPRAIQISTAPRRTVTDYNTLSPCADTSGRQSSGWCVQPGNSFTGRAGHPNPLSVSLCRLPGTLTGRAEFPSTAEVSLSMATPSPASRPVWALLNQHPGRPSLHTVPVAAGTCLTWNLSWFGRDDAGRDAPAGHYTLSISVSADNLSTPNSAVQEDYDYTLQ